MAPITATFAIVAGILALVIIGMLLYDAIGITAVRRTIRALPGVSFADKDAAQACMWRALRTDWRTRVFDLSAPVVMAFVIPFVPRSANRLPNLFSAWDNNISLNGDSGGVWIPADHPEFIRYGTAGEGAWVDYHDVMDWEAVQGCVMVSYDDERYQGDAYYAEGWHPRSWWARWIWVGLRNRATKLALILGAAVDRPIETLSGSLDISTGTPGHFLLRSGDTYHFKSFEPFHLLGFALCRIRSYGYKLEIALKSPKESERVAVVAIGWSAKGAKV